MLFPIIISALFIQTSMAAGSFTINPVPINQDQFKQQNLNEFSHASININGKGTELKIDYSTKAPIDLYILFLNGDGTLNPNNILFAKLPEGENRKVSVPISHTRGWSYGEKNYKLHFFTTKNIFPTISKAELVDNLNFIDGIKQLFMIEPFTPSSYHRLNGYKLFGFSATLILLIIALIGSIIFIKNKRIILLIFLTAILISNARFSLDTFRYTLSHLKEWSTKDTYASTGSSYEIAKYLKKNNIEEIKFCSDGNSYFKTVLSYALYPIRISDNSDYALVHNAFKWSFEDKKLKCGKIESNAIKLNEFPDGSILFQLN